jgi:hypothetical protein
MAATFVSALELPVLASAPASPTAGMAYVRASDYHVLVYGGAGWVDQAAGASVFKQSVDAEIVADTTTTSTSFVDLLSLTVTTTGSSFLLTTFSAAFTNSSGVTYRRVEFQLLIDGVPQHGCLGVATSTNGATIAMVDRLAVSAGTHTVTVQWRTSANTAQIRPSTVTEDAHLLVCEVSA